MSDLPDHPAAISLEGRFVRLEPLSDEHIPDLAAAARDPRIWGYSVRGEVDDYLGTAQHWMRTGAAVPFAVRQKSDCRIVGMTRLFDIVTPHRRLELGYTWYVPEVWGTVVNPEAKRLLLGHAFEGWGAHRVEFKIHHGNLRSQAAVAKLGAVREGVLRAHMILPDGTRRDSVVFSIIADEWPNVRARLDERLKGYSPENQL
ncbi:GNAT family N-acetyltransferase [Terrihabitans sp. B22-R8]|uniref:GNAT family N-acetyltransferase n=1 Tax=Terrihabitans sp. B22-R8 TaxID=3425128 RepID=UPI00403CA1FA